MTEGKIDFYYKLYTKSPTRHLLTFGEFIDTVEYATTGRVVLIIEADGLGRSAEILAL
jgi:hypothetical protein